RAREAGTARGSLGAPKRKRPGLASEEPVDAAAAVRGRYRETELARLEGKPGVEILGETRPDRVQDGPRGRSPRDGVVMGEEAAEVSVRGHVRIGREPRELSAFRERRPARARPLAE